MTTNDSDLGLVQETQREFMFLFEDQSSGIIANNEFLSIDTFERYVDATRIKLNLCISPSLLLLSNSLIINEKRISGFNNIIKHGDENLKFGVNDDINNDNIQMKGHDDPVKRIIDEPEETPILEDDSTHEYAFLGLLIGTILISYAIF